MVNWECRAKLLKQLPAKPAERRGPVSGEAAAPSPMEYETPQLYCGKGYGHIKRAPAYTFGTPVGPAKPPATVNAKTYNLRGITNKGQSKVPGGVVGIQLEIIRDHTRKPGPAVYAPPADSRVKRPPAYSCQPPARPPYQPWDMWTCPPNMYCPYVPFKKAPAYSFGDPVKDLTTPQIPGPGAHNPKHDYPRKKLPAFSFGYPFRSLAPPEQPPPNRYCEKKFMVPKRTAPAPSFGIQHSPYLGVQPAYLKPSYLDAVTNSGTARSALCKTSARQIGAFRRDSVRTRSCTRGTSGTCRRKTLPTSWITSNSPRKKTIDSDEKVVISPHYQGIVP